MKKNGNIHDNISSDIENSEKKGWIRMPQKDLEALLEKEIKTLERLQQKLLQQLSNTPEGTLHIHKSGSDSKPQYYNYLNGKRIYLAKKERTLASALAQKNYDEDVLALIAGRLKAAKQLLTKYEFSILDVYERLPETRKDLITPIIPSDEEYVKDWYEQHPGYANPYPNHSALYTERGEMVRSKSEKILADLFYKRGIPYVYESRLEFGNGKMIYPDFLLLDVVRRKTYVYEHFGMMDNPDYVKGALEKMSLYAEHGYWVGDSLLFSFETSTSPLNTKNVERMLCHFM